MTDGTKTESGSPKLTPDIARGLSRTQRMALARTLMANQRTVLSYVRTAIGLLATGYGLVALAEHPLLEAAGVGAMAISGLVVILGFVRYHTMRKVIGRFPPSEMVSLEYSLLHDEVASDDASVAAVSSDR